MSHTTVDAPARPARRLHGVRRGFDVVYCYLSAAFVAGVLLQVFFAGVGVFGINAAKVANASSFDLHRGWGFVLMVTSLVLLIIALVARESARTMIAALVLAVLTIVAQNVLAAFGDNDKWIGGLHALDGILILLLSAWIAIVAWRRRPG